MTTYAYFMSRSSWCSLAWCWHSPITGGCWAAYHVLSSKGPVRGDPGQGTHRQMNTSSKETLLRYNLCKIKWIHLKPMLLCDFTKVGSLATGGDVDGCLPPSQWGGKRLLWGQVGSGEVVGASHPRLPSQRSTWLSLLLGLWFLWANQLLAPSEEVSSGKVGKALGPGGPSNLQIQDNLTVSE